MPCDAEKKHRNTFFGLWVEADPTDQVVECPLCVLGIPELDLK